MIWLILKKERMWEWIHWESANNGVLLEYKASCWENGESWRTELTKWISHLLKGSRMLRDPKNPVHSIASCPRSIALRTHFNGNHFDRKFSESHIFLFLLLNPHTSTKTRKNKLGEKITCSEDVIIELQHLDEGAVEEELRVGDRICPIFPHPEKNISTSGKNIFASWKENISSPWTNIFTSWKKYFFIMNKYFHILKKIFLHHE